MEERKNVRYYGLDLLRLVVMLMVPLLHVLGHNNVLASTTELSVNYDCAWFLECFAFCAVDVFAMLSGYVGVKAKRRYTNIVLLWLQVFFYSVILTILFAVINHDNVGVRGLACALFPVLSGRYWYFTAYVCVFFMQPLLNAGMQKLGKKRASVLIVAMFVLFSVMPTVSLRDVFQESYGYSAIWLMVLYCFGAYLALYFDEAKMSLKKAFFGYLACSMITWGSKMVLEYGTRAIFGETKLGGILIEYTSPTVLLAGVFLLLLFRKLQPGPKTQRIIAKLAPLAFGVYLIHEHPAVASMFITGKFTDYAALSAPKMILAVLGTALAIWVIGMAIDALRMWVFNKLRIKENLLMIEERWAQRQGQE